MIGDFSGETRSSTLPSVQYGTTQGGTGLAGSTSGTSYPAGVDPAAAQADPAGYQQWLQGAAQYQQSQQAQPYSAPSTNYAQNTGFSDTQNLIGTQIAPGATQSYTPYQQAYGAANQQMQGLGYDFGQANTQYNTALSALQSGQNQAMQLYGGLTGMNFGGGGSASVGNVDPAQFSGMASLNDAQFQQDLNKALSGLEGPSRAALAQEAYSLMADRSQSDYDMALRNASAQNVALGRAGSGMITSALSDVADRRSQEMARIQRDMALNAAEQSLQDRLNISNQQMQGAQLRLGAADMAARLQEAGYSRQDAMSIANSQMANQRAILNAQLADSAMGRSQQGAMFGANLQRGIAGDIYGMGADRSKTLMGLGDRFSEQSVMGTGLGERKAQFATNTATNQSNLASLQNTLDASLRNELRGERDYQNQLSTQAQQDQLGMQNFNEFLRSRGWGEMMGASGLGYGDDPYSAMINQANNYGQQANTLFGGIGGLMGAAGSLWGGASTPVAGASTPFAGASTGSTPLFDNGYNYPP